MARVLVIDDDEDMRGVVLGTLELRSHDGHAAADGREGLKLARSLVPDVVLLDCRMPGMDGVAVLQAFKADEGLRHIPVVMMTANCGEDDVARYRQLGAVGVLEKPFEPLDLLSLVSSFGSKSGRA